MGYVELDKIANKVGNYFKKRNRVKKGEIVTVLMRNPLYNLYLIFGLSKIGAIYAPVNFRFIEPFLSYVFNDLQSRIIVLESSLAKNVNEVVDSVREYDIAVVDKGVLKTSS